MAHRRLTAVLLVSAALFGLTACTTATPTPDDTVAAQPDIAGEWVVTRTVVSSDDATNPARAVGATSVRYVSVDRDPCDTSLCTGSVASGETTEDRESTALTQTDGGFEYTFTGSLDCMDTSTGGVLAVGAFGYTQLATLSVASSSGSGADASASSLTGTLEYTDTLTAKAAANGCVRSPVTVTVSYSLSAVRAP
jgi:hypothetical protein